VLFSALCMALNLLFMVAFFVIHNARGDEMSAPTPQHQRSICQQPVQCLLWMDTLDRRLGDRQGREGSVEKRRLSWICGEPDRYSLVVRSVADVLHIFSGLQTDIYVDICNISVQQKVNAEVTHTVADIPQYFNCFCKPFPVDIMRCKTAANPASTQCRWWCGSFSNIIWSLYFGIFIRKGFRNVRTCVEKLREW
jgi:hypothetical protein